MSSRHLCHGCGMFHRMRVCGSHPRSAPGGLRVGFGLCVAVDVRRPWVLLCVPMCACSKWSEYVHVLLCGVTPASFHSISTDACLCIPCSRPCSYCQSRSCMHAFRHPMYVESGRMCPSVSGSRLKVHPRPSRRRTSSSSRLRHVLLCAWTIAC